MFSTSPRGVLRLTLSLLVLVILAEPVHAQGNTSRVSLLAELTKQDQDRARQEETLRNQQAKALIREAQELETSGDPLKAARRYESAGLLRSAHDAAAVEAFSASARAYDAAEKPRDAARMSEMAAKRALEVGDVYVAAVSFRHAAAIRAEIGQEIRSQELAWRSCRLSNSPSLSEMERAKIQAGFTNCSVELQRLAMSMEN